MYTVTVYKKTNSNTWSLSLPSDEMGKKNYKYDEWIHSAVTWTGYEEEAIWVQSIWTPPACVKIQNLEAEEKKKTEEETPTEGLLSLKDHTGALVF